MSRHFTSSGFLPSGSLLNRAGDTVNFADLPPFLRVLLTTDGTVTKSLESFFWEPVRVANTQQAYSELSDSAPDISCVAGDRVLRRRVELVGGNSGRCFALADSLIRTGILPEGLQVDLETGVVGVGELLRECSLETYREIVDFGYSGLEEEAVWRRYRIVVGKRPAIQITEHFPVALYGRHCPPP